MKEIICADSLDVMREIPNSCIDLIITSPPYNLNNSTGGRGLGKSRINPNPKVSFGYDQHNDNMPHEIYVEWQRNMLLESMRILKPEGAIFYNHKWRVQNGLLQDRNDIIQGFPVRQIIIWQRSGGVNFNKGYFLPTYEVIYMICGKKFKLMRGANALTDVWKVDQERNSLHPAPFPIEIPLRIIDSVECEIVLDPFNGSGTTTLAAEMRGKNYIGIDNSQTYCDMALNRIANYVANK